MKKLFILLLILSSCKKEVFYYPSKQFFKENNPKEIIVNNLNFKEITDSIRNELYRKKHYYIKIVEDNKEYKIKPLANTGGYIKERNILEIVNDSLWFLDKLISIKQLKKSIKLHYENNGNIKHFSESYKKAFIKLTLEPKISSEEFKNKLLNIIKIYNLTSFKNKDSVKLNIMLDYPLDEIYNRSIPPRPFPLERTK